MLYSYYYYKRYSADVGNAIIIKFLKVNFNETIFDLEMYSYFIYSF